MGKLGLGYNLVAGLHQRHDGEEHDWLAAGRDHHLAGFNLQAARRIHVIRDGFLKLRQPRGRAVVGVALPEGLNGGLDNVRRRVEVRLAYLQMHHVVALGLQSLGLR